MIPAEHPRCLIGEGEGINLTLHCLINKNYLRSGPQRSRRLHSVEKTWVRNQIDVSHTHHQHSVQNSGNFEQSSKMDDVFRKMIDHSSDKGTPQTRHHGHLGGDEESQYEGDEEAPSLDDCPCPMYATALALLKFEK